MSTAHFTKRGMASERCVAERIPELRRGFQFPGCGLRQTPGVRARRRPVQPHCAPDVAQPRIGILLGIFLLFSTQGFDRNLQDTRSLNRPNPSQPQKPRGCNVTWGTQKDTLVPRRVSLHPRPFLANWPFRSRHIQSEQMRSRFAIREKKKTWLRTAHENWVILRNSNVHVPPRLRAMGDSH